jgi:hypothetical protein
MSPHYLTASTLGDMIRSQTNGRGKVIGIAMKDRGAILPAGRTADAAYWFVGADEGVWATSNWYMNALPAWVTEFNKQKKADAYLAQTWNLLRDASVYDESAADNNAHETPFKGTTKPTFPYDLPALKAANGNYELLKATPFGNSLTVDFAREVIQQEQLGTDAFTDMLCMSFSSTDYIGHQFGIHAVETQDCYLRLDEELSGFLRFLDEKVGKGNYTVFLSADHGGAPTPSYTAKRKAIGGYWKSDKLELFLEDTLAKRYGEGDWVLNESNQNVFLNHRLIQTKRLNAKEIQYEVAQLCLTFPEIMNAYTASDLSQSRGGELVKNMIQQGFDAKRSGDVIYTLDGSRIVAAAGCEILVYDSTDGTLEKAIKAHKDPVVCLTPLLGNGFASGGADKQVIIWSANLQGVLKFSHNDIIQSLSQNPITGVVLTCSGSDFGLWTPDVKAVPKTKVFQDFFY